MERKSDSQILIAKTEETEYSNPILYLTQKVVLTTSNLSLICEKNSFQGES